MTDNQTTSIAPLRVELNLFEAALKAVRHLLHDLLMGEFPFWRHRERGSVYIEMGRGELQSSRPIVEGDRLTAYRGSDGQWWFRPCDEFDDGRFERLDHLQNAEAR